jgi:hypothetical protein
MSTDKFLDIYTDDFLMLIGGREALLTHPLRPAVKGVTDAVYCRLLAIPHGRQHRAHP